MAKFTLGNFEIQIIINHGYWESIFMFYSVLSAPLQILVFCVLCDRETHPSVLECKFIE
jgi:cytochrome c oxidase subunit IV